MAAHESRAGDQVRDEDDRRERRARELDDGEGRGEEAHRTPRQCAPETCSAFTPCMSCKSPTSDRGMRRFASCTIALAIGLAHSSPARADPLRLRGDALAETQGSSSPTGLVVLQGEDTARPWVSAEGLVWAGGSSLTGDVLVLTVRVREPHRYVDVHAGRFVLATGAVHPVQIDGAHVVARAPWGSTVEAFGGAPVVPRFGPRPYDWLAGGRVAQTVAFVGTLGMSYVQRREDGEISDEEVGADVAAAPARWFDSKPRSRRSPRPLEPGPGGGPGVGGRVRWSDWRVELFRVADLAWQAPAGDVALLPC